MRGLVIGILLGMCGFLAICAATDGVPGHADVSERHTLVAATDLDDLVPVGSAVAVDCELTDGVGYLAVAPAPGNTVLVFTVTAAQLDSAPRGPFPESCAQWRQRHHVSTDGDLSPGSA